MAYSCLVCDKKSSVGMSQRHHRGVAGKRWRNRATEVKRVFKPNLQIATLTYSGEVIKSKVCTSCLKKLKKEGVLHGFRFV